jgi:hypothetical protein
MSSPSSSDVSTAAILLVLIVAILARRTYLLMRGARYSPGRLFGFTGFYVLLFALLAVPTIFAAVSSWGVYGWLLIAAYAVVPAAAAVVAVPYVRRIVRFEERGSGQWYYSLPWHIPVLYLSLFVVRFVLEILLFGPAFVTSFALPASIPTGALLVLAGVDLLFGLSTGILVGRSVGVYRAFSSRSPESSASRSPQEKLA